MEPLENQRQIWQRVRGGEPPAERLELRTLVLEAGETESALRRSAGFLNGGQRQQALALAARAGEEIAVLRGIHWLDTGSAFPYKLPPAPGESPPVLLRACYFRSLRAQSNYTARSLEPRFGGLFLLLAQRAQERCLAIARILGKMA